MQQGRNVSFATGAKEAALGALAGAVAVWAMDRVDWFAYRHDSPNVRERTKEVRPEGMDPAHGVVDHAAHGDFKNQQHNPAGAAVHYAVGVLPAAVYGAVRPSLPVITKGHGILFGLGLFVLQDEGLNPLLGLAAKPQKYPWQAHARGLVAHVLYGLALETTLGVLQGRPGLRAEAGHLKNGGGIAA